MKKVYAICSGEYSDWSIKYMFESEEKRNKVLEKLNKGKTSYDYGLYYDLDYELSDDKFDLEKCEDYSYAICKYTLYKGEEKFSMKIVDTNIFIEDKDSIKSERNNGYSKWGSETELYFCRIITNKNYDEYSLEQKYLKVARDYISKAKYMEEVDGINPYEISKKLFGKQTP